MSDPHLIILILFVWALGATGMCMWLGFKLDEAKDQIAWLKFDKNYLNQKLTKKGDQ